MNQKKTSNVIALSDAERAEYFIRKVADFEELWGGFADGWLQLGNQKNRRVIPFWPEEIFVQNYINENKINAYPRRIELCHFLENWVPGMEKDGARILIFPIKESQGVLVNPTKLADQLKDELEQYE
ncbi:DUF2750 domain-containing protein [Pseudomonas viridiflava]|uniref:DUF2750 domain-containing protein n=1 Tax=Pseudomonas viridiflava TaxID=33069 RepID=UPI00177E2AF4|nr:DUF2750 domain-containing protein [Pseudomonas viridiflava]MBD8204566.1 DUF2750 domain-containing protein [Pseudomonas viridiflava]